MSEFDFSIFTRMLNFRADGPKVEDLVDRVSENPDFIKEIAMNVPVEFRPNKSAFGHVKAVGLGAFASIPTFFATIAFMKPSYVITSPEVVSGQGIFALPNRALRAAENMGLKVIDVPFNAYPEFDTARKLLNVVQSGAVVLNGLSVEVSTFIARNAGCGMLVFARPEDGKLVFKLV